MEYWLGWFHETNNGDEVKKIARRAEELHFSGVALSDHVALPKIQQSRHPMLGIPFDPATPNIEPMTTAATMAAVTDKLRFMTYACVMGMRDPFTVAKQAGALADLTDNRFSLGITPGWNTDEIALLGHDPGTRGKRFVESLDVIKGLWDQDLFSYSGDHYNFSDVGIAPRPRICPQIFVGGNSAVAIKRAAANAGWIGMNHSIDELKVSLASLGELSNGKAQAYVFPAEKLSNDYIHRLEGLGVTGIVVIPWLARRAGAVSLEEKLGAMKSISERWIS